jgi:alginate O-acetyltransferase complex protein AlgI
MIVFLLTGLWHGAGWAFPLWGLYHGAWLMIERRMHWRHGVNDTTRRPWLRRASVLFIVLIGWVLFRAESLGLAADYYRAMFVPTGGFTSTVDVALGAQALVALLLGACVVLLPGRRSGGRLMTEGTGPWVVAARVVLVAVVLPLALAMAFSSTYSPFLYFQF